MISYLFKLLTCFDVAFVVLFVAGNECSTTTLEEIENHLGTKTPYRTVANFNDRKLHFDGCENLRIWSLIRHGTRNPGKRMIRRAKNHLTKIRDKIISSNKFFCAEEIDQFRNWTFDIDEQEEMFLVHKGEDELLLLAERMQNRFPYLLPGYYDHSYYKFKYTATQRTKMSAEYFVTGLFGRDQIGQIEYPEAIEADPILRFYRKCDRWKIEVNKNPESLYEVREFIRGEEMSDVVKSIIKQTGVQSLKAADIHLIYTTCAFETAWRKYKISPWCKLFNRHTIKVMEFQEDLEYYWIDGYGNELTYKQACPAIIDMINHIKPSSSEPNATFYFTHSGTILKFLAHLGLYKDDFGLTNVDFYSNRKWRVSKIDSFASNLAFIGLNCADGYKILTMHQERIINVPGCPQDNDLCDFTTFEKVFEASTSDCRFEEMCKSGK